MKIIFAGTPDFAVPALQQLIKSQHHVCAVYTQPDRPAGRGRKRRHSPVKTLALDANIPVLQPETLKTEVDLNCFSSFVADLMVVVAYGIILPQTILDIPRLGCINIHGSLLPRWRGAAPIHRALMAGDTTTGITIMKVIKKLDAGDILHKKQCLIKPHQTSSDLYYELANLGAIGLLEVLAQMEQGTLVASKQDESCATYAAKLDKKEALISWNHSAIAIDRQIRGLNSWPVAQTVCQDYILRIWKARITAETSELPAGTVLQKNKQFSVSTGKGVIDMLEIQLPGKRRMEVQHFLNSRCLDGVVLG